MNTTTKPARTRQGIRDCMIRPPDRPVHRIEETPKAPPVEKSRTPTAKKTARFPGMPLEAQFARASRYLAAASTPSCLAILWVINDNNAVVTFGGIAAGVGMEPKALRADLKALSDAGFVATETFENVTKYELTKEGVAFYNSSFAKSAPTT